jgi:hypothetical protein
MATMNKQEAAYEISSFSDTIRYCALHEAFFRGSGDVDAAVKYWQAHFEDYIGVFSSPAEAKEEIKAAVAETFKRLSCAQCDETDHPYEVRS